MGNVSDTSCRESQKHTFQAQQLSPQNRAVYEIKWKKIGRTGQATDIIRRMRIVYCVTKTTNTHS